MKKSLTVLLAPLLLASFTLPVAQASDFTAIDRKQARQLVDPVAYKQPTVVALWSSDCSHCKKNLKLFKELGQREKQLTIISIATEPESPALTAHLAALPASQRYAYGHESPEALAFALDPEWHGELPRTLLFDGKGGRVALSGVLDEASIRRALHLKPGKSPAN